MKCGIRREISKRKSGGGDGGNSIRNEVDLDQTDGRARLKRQSEGLQMHGEASRLLVEHMGGMRLSATRQLGA
jgi:hypothetical protein